MQTKVCRVTEALAIFGENLKRARKHQGLSQEDLEKITRVHRTHISKIERNLCEPGAETVARLLVALGLDGGPLFAGVVPTGIEPRPPQASPPR
jgi:transcriptional regulator with XRE-family HTH domain